MKGLKTKHVITALSIALFGFTLLCLIIVWGVNSTLNEQLDTEKLRSEALLSESLLLEKARKKSGEQLSTLSSANIALSDALEESKNQLIDFQQKNDDLTHLIEKVKEGSKGQLVHQEKLEQQVQVNQSAYLNLLSESRKLADTIVLLRAQSQFIAGELIRAKRTRIDHTLITAVKNNETGITAKAHCARKLIANAEVPAALGNLSFALYDMDGTPLADDEGVFTSRILGDDYNYTASMGRNSKETLPEIQRIEIMYTRKERFKPGTYTLKVLSDSLYVGSMQIKLR